MQDEEKAVKNISKRKPAIVLLEEPIEWGEETIDKVILKPIKGAHFKGFPKDPAVTDILKLASKLSGISSAVFDEMGSRDILKIVEAVGELF
jgi:hypothetical protein